MISKALKQLRGELEITQRQMAKELDLDATTINRWERRKTVPQRLSALMILDFAKQQGASKECYEKLYKAIFPTRH